MGTVIGVAGLAGWIGATASCRGSRAAGRFARGGAGRRQALLGDDLHRMGGRRVVGGGRTGLTSVVSVVFLVALFLRRCGDRAGGGDRARPDCGRLLDDVVDRGDDFGDLEVGFPALLTMVGDAVDLQHHQRHRRRVPHIQLHQAGAGQVAGQVHPMMYAAAAAFLVYFALPSSSGSFPSGEGGPAE